ncbi:DUF718 domain protein [Penicillium maclennaniae]|uniref:DUF718 domain protein n=1 Tax=Penicillium maclennaniae TaxID=1343394 RepID=UPI0025418A43|nr:DUF718 domain protein [Penicillium maclennaniae]KAJ5682026.1 DUF718 domain protein [Penicillium maclennaniae]
MQRPRRVAQIIHLRPAAIEAYKECHAKVWPEVLQQIYDCNLRNYSIFFDNDRTLFAVFEYVGEDFKLDMAKMKANSKVREWWNMTDAMQVWQSFLLSRGEKDRIVSILIFTKESLIFGATGSADGPGWWKDLDEVFHVD